MVPLLVWSSLWVCVQEAQFSVIPYLKERFALQTEPMAPGLTLRNEGDYEMLEDKDVEGAHTFSDFTVKGNLDEIKHGCTNRSRACADQYHIATKDGSNL